MICIRTEAHAAQLGKYPWRAALERVIERFEHEDGRALAEKLGYRHFETSAKSGVMVRDAFYLLACTVMNAKLEADPANAANERGATDLMDGGGKEKGKGCAC